MRSGDPISPMPRPSHTTSTCSPGCCRAVVHVGAGVSFVVPFSLDDARAFWTDKVLPGVTARRAACSSRGSTPYRRHGADRSGDGAQPAASGGGAQASGAPVCAAARDRASADGGARTRARQRLDAADARHWTGQAGERLYRSLGYTAIGSIPRFARGSTTPDLEPGDDHVQGAGSVVGLGPQGHDRIDAGGRPDRPVRGQRRDHQERPHGGGERNRIVDGGARHRLAHEPRGGDRHRRRRQRRRFRRASWPPRPPAGGSSTAWRRRRCGWRSRDGGDARPRRAPHRGRSLPAAPP